MNDTYLTPGHIHPTLEVLSSKQLMWFNQPSAGFTLQNYFQPKDNLMSLVNMDFSNNSFSGFRFTHKTSENDDYGSFTLSSFVNADPIGNPILLANGVGAQFFVPVRGIAPVANNDLATKEYVDEHIALIKEQIGLK